MQIIPSIYGVKITYCADHWRPELSSHWLLFYIFAYYLRKIQLIAFIIWQPCKHCFWHPARCRVQNQDLFSGFRSVQSPKTKLVFWTSQCAESKNRVCFRVLHAAECKIRTCFRILHTAERKNKVCFWTLHAAEWPFKTCFLYSAHCGMQNQHLFLHPTAQWIIATYAILPSCSALDRPNIGRLLVPLYIGSCIQILFANHWVHRVDLTASDLLYYDLRNK